MSRQSIPSTQGVRAPFEPVTARDGRERNAILLASVALYLVLLWVCWPSLSFGANQLGDRAWLDTFRELTPGQALLQLSSGWLRPGESCVYWLIAHSPSLFSWRVLLLGVFFATTLYVQYDATQRGGSYLDGFGAALAFSLNSTALSVVCWLSALHISLCAFGLLAYVGFARLALDSGGPRTDYVAAALAALLFALSFYELAMFAPLVVLAQQRWASPHAHRRVVRGLNAGAGACVGLYLTVQLSATPVLQRWSHESGVELLTSSMRYAMRNYYLWFNPFETFGVLIPDDPGAHGLENAVCWLLMFGGFVIAWAVRKTDPISALSGVWFSVFLIPVGTFLRFEGEPVALQHLYIPILGVAVGGVRLITRGVERAIAAIRNRTFRVVFESTLSAVLLWSLAPLIAECREAVERWSDAQTLYVATIQNYPSNAGVLGRLTDTLTSAAPVLSAPVDRRPPPHAWEKLLHGVLMRREPETAARLLARGRALMRASRYTEAASALARAFVASASEHEQLESGTALVHALSRTELKDRALPLLDALRQRYPLELQQSANEQRMP